jgi:hypothetical protein
MHEELVSYIYHLHGDEFRLALRNHLVSYCNGNSWLLGCNDFQRALDILDPDNPSPVDFMEAMRAFELGMRYVKD